MVRVENFFFPSLRSYLVRFCMQNYVECSFFFGVWGVKKDTEERPIISATSYSHVFVWDAERERERERPTHMQKGASALTVQIEDPLFTWRRKRRRTTTADTFF